MSTVRKCFEWVLNISIAFSQKLSLSSVTKIRTFSSKGHPLISAAIPSIVTYWRWQIFNIFKFFNFANPSSNELFVKSQLPIISSFSRFFKFSMEYCETYCFLMMLLSKRIFRFPKMPISETPSMYESVRVCKFGNRQKISCTKTSPIASQSTRKLVKSGNFSGICDTQNKQLLLRINSESFEKYNTCEKWESCEKKQ